MKTTEHKKQISTILIAEDDDFNFLYLKTILNKKDAEVFRASNGKEAVRMFENNNNFDMIFLDINMPEYDGFYALKIIKSQKKEVPVIIQTANYDPDSFKLFKQIGCDEIIKKPYTKDEIFKIYHRYILC
jgi:CheY-like chemotaxis protein